LGPWHGEAVAPAGFRQAGGAPGREGSVARPHAHLGPGGDRSLGGEIASVSARRGPAAAAVVGGVAGEGGSLLANKRRLRLTCELEGALVCRPATKSPRRMEAR
jgi:hypothetical protein